MSMCVCVCVSASHSHTYSLAQSPSVPLSHTHAQKASSGTSSVGRASLASAVSHEDFASTPANCEYNFHAGFNDRKRSREEGEFVEACWDAISCKTFMLCIHIICTHTWHAAAVVHKCSIQVCTEVVVHIHMLVQCPDRSPSRVKKRSRGRGAERDKGAKETD